MALIKNDPRKPDKLATIVQVIPEPNEENVVETLTAMKEALETLAQLRGEVETRAITFDDLNELGIIEILPNGAIENKNPFGVPSENTVGMLKFCDGLTEDFGQGLGWYYLGSNREWQFITATPA